jgi:hypothetical protein
VRLRINRNACKAELQVSNTNIGLELFLGKAICRKDFKTGFWVYSTKTLSGSWWEVPTFISPTRMLRAQRRFFVRRGGGWMQPPPTTSMGSQRGGFPHDLQAVTDRVHTRAPPLPLRGPIFLQWRQKEQTLFLAAFNSIMRLSAFVPTAAFQMCL